MSHVRMQARLLPDGRRLHLNDGPIDLIIGAHGSPGAVRDAYRAAAARFATVLDELCAELPLLRRQAVPDAAPSGAIARLMWAAVLPHAGFITPMAAVAGSVADTILRVMTGAAPLDRVFVNNGGDIALHLRPGHVFTAGLVDRPDRPALQIGRIAAGDGVGGIATSGWRGRSFSLGIADAVTILAADAATADAAATVVANAVDLPGHPAIARRPAASLQPDSDLGGRLVTVAVGELSPGEVALALDRGAERARGLPIAGAVLRLGGQTRVVDGPGRVGHDRLQRPGAVMTRVFAAAALAVLVPSLAQAADIQPAVVFDMGGKFDKSFNESVHNGAEAFTKATGIAVREFEPQNDTQREQALRNFARRGQDPIVAVGFNQASAVKTVAAEFPQLHFVIIDSVVDAPNVQSILFREEQGSYLAGMMAALKSGSGTIGFVGGMDVPLIRKFACGYVQGAHAVNAGINVLQNMTGSTPAAWNDPVRGAELARSQIERGADVIFQAAGATGTGVLQAAADAGKFGIGVDSNQDYIHPGHVLTSMVKELDVATQTTLKASQSGSWKAGTLVLGVKEGGVGVSFDEYNQDLISAEMKAAVEKARDGIAAGTLEVHDYMSDRRCPS